MVKQDLNSLGLFPNSWFKTRLCCAIKGRSDEVAGFIDYLHQLHHRTRIIDDRADDIRALEALTSLLVKARQLETGVKLTGQALSDDEKLIYTVPDLTSASEGVKRAIIATVATS